jgi:hypothetical protein
MPTISMFFGILIRMFFYDNKEHKLPHIHVQYNEFEATISIDTGEILEGKLPQKQMRLVQAWIEIRKEDLIANWTLAVNGETPMKIDPLK